MPLGKSKKIKLVFEFNGAHQLLVYADINFLDDNINIKKREQRNPLSGW
jgi:hypothetical protein